jgi:hypothetical protein
VRGRSCVVRPCPALTGLRRGFAVYTRSRFPRADKLSKGDRGLSGSLKWPSVSRKDANTARSYVSLSRLAQGI